MGAGTGPALIFYASTVAYLSTLGFRNRFGRPVALLVGRSARPSSGLEITTDKSPVGPAAKAVASPVALVSQRK